MLNPEALFDPAPAQGADLITHAAFLERARAERERGRESASQLALGAYLVARLVERVLSAASEGEDGLEGLRWQLQSTQRFIRDLPSTEVEVSHLAGIVDGAATPPPHREAVLRMSLIAYAYFLEQEGRLEEALEVLGAAGRTYGGRIPPQEYPALALFAARLNRVLARWDQATRIYEAAGSAAEAIGDRRSQLLSRLGRANVLRGQGNLPAARAEVEQVIADAFAPELVDVQARAYSDLAAVLDRQGLAVESISANYRAFRLYRDPIERWRALANLGVALKEVGASGVARQAFDLVLARSETFSIRTNALLELMDLESGAGDEMGFRRCLNEAQGLADRMSPSMAVDFHHKMGVGLVRFGRAARGRRALLEALALAERHRLNEWYFRIDRVLRGLDACERERAAKAGSAAAEAEAAPAIAAVAEGLRQYAGAAAR